MIPKPLPLCTIPITDPRVDEGNRSAALAPTTSPAMPSLRPVKPTNSAKGQRLVPLPKTSTVRTPATCILSPAV